MKKVIKKIIFVLIVVSLIFTIGIVIKVGNFKKLEGYMYSLAMGIDSEELANGIINNNSSANNTTSNGPITNNATCSNATSSNATSSNATSSNATSCNATSGNATSSNSGLGGLITETIKVTNVPKEETNTNINEEEKKETNTSNNQNKPNNTKIEQQPNKTEEDNKEESLDLEYNNSEITKAILNKIADSTEIKNITINVDADINVKKELFEAIEGKKTKLTINSGENQIIFRGSSITNPKTINTVITYTLVDDDVLLREIAKEGIVINFANNGELPGTATIRIKATKEIRETLNASKMPIYHYDETTKELTQLKNNAKYNDEGFIEFSIDHNSKYLIVNEIIEEKEYTVTMNNSQVVDNEVSFLESHRMYILIIGIAVLTIIIVTVIVIVDKKTKGRYN